MTTTPPTPQPRRFARGTVYIAALGLGLMVATLGTGAMAVARSANRSASLTADAITARTLAAGAIQQALRIYGSSQTAREATFGTDLVTSTTIKIPNTGIPAVVSITARSNATTKFGASTASINITTSGQVGAARQRLSLVIEPVRTPISSLGVAGYSAGTLNYNSVSVKPASQTIQCAGSLTMTNCNIQPTTKYGTSISRSASSGTTIKDTNPLTAPIASSVFDYYIAVGTPINGTTISNMDKILLSPTSNPYGTVNPLGIYVLDAKGKDIRVRSSRMVCTLVVINPPSTFTVDQSVNWTPARPGLPALLVQGSATISISDDDLKEQGTNLNPTGSPYPFPGGTTNHSNGDKYPSKIDGLVYATGTITFTNGESTLHSAIAGTQLRFTNSKVTFAYDNRYLIDPPPGFYTSTMTPKRGSWKILTD
jgi:hypothetical protein